MYWLVALPLGDEGPDQIWSKLQEVTTYSYDYSLNFKFRIPENLRVGTLDSLLALSDDLIKVNAAVEGTVNKIRRQLYDLQASLPEDERSDVWVEGETPEGYLQRFAWNEAKYPSRRAPKETVQAIMDTVQKLDDDLKVHLPSYNTHIWSFHCHEFAFLSCHVLANSIPNIRLLFPLPPLCRLEQPNILRPGLLYKLSYVNTLEV